MLDGDTVKGEYHEVFDVVFDDNGKRLENVVFAPQSSLENGGLSMDQGDIEDIRNRLPFVLTSDEIGEYDILYVGQQQEDELHCYVFDIAPKQIVGKKRYFQGRIWVDDHDFQIVKTYGKTVPRYYAARRKRKKSISTRASPPGANRSTGRTGSRLTRKADDMLHFIDRGHPHPRDREVRELQEVRFEDEESPTRARKCRRGRRSRRKRQK